MNISRLTVCGLLLTGLLGCDIAGVTKTEIKAEPGKWEITLTTRVPEKNITTTLQKEYCLTAEDIDNLINTYRYIDGYDDCTSSSLKLSKDSSEMDETLSCSNTIVGAINTTVYVSKGNNVFSKMVSMTGSNIVSLYTRQMRDAGLKKPPMDGDHVEIVEIAAQIGACNLADTKKSRIENRELFRHATSTGSAKSDTPIKTKLSDFLDEEKPATDTQSQ